MFRSILVAVDGSQAATAALEEAIELARADGARLTLISVATPYRWTASVGPYVAPVPLEAERVRLAEEIAERAERLVPDDVPVSTVVRRGPVARAILERIETGEHDLVVMGSRGFGRIRSLLLGSVSRTVAARSPVPVRITRARKRSADVPDAEPAIAT